MTLPQLLISVIHTKKRLAKLLAAASAHLPGLTNRAGSKKEHTDD